MGRVGGKDSTITGTTNATWPGDMWKTGGAATWLGGTYDPDTEPAVLRHRPAGALEQLAAPRRQSLQLLDAGHRPGQRRDQVALPGHAARRLGLRRRQRVHPVRAREGRQEDPRRRQGRPQRVLLRARPHQRRVHQRLAVRLQDHLGQGLSATMAGRSPTRRRGRRARPSRRPPMREHGSAVFNAPSFLGAQELDADGLQPEDRPVLRAQQRMGHGHLERGRSPTRRARPISAPASTSSRSTTTISACCAPSTRPPARSSSRSRTARRCGAAC